MALTKRLFLGSLVCGLLAGCGGSEWSTDYSDAITPETSANWRVTGIEVIVPETLTISEKNVYRPDADIVWRGEPDGDRRAQISAIVTEAAQRGSAGLNGRKAVTLRVEMAQFHALSDIARAKLKRSGVHNIMFTAEVLDAKSGQILAGPEFIKADLVAYTGPQAVEAEKEGQTQRVRIVNHLSAVFAGWLGTGPDTVRGTFKRLGR
ncbi:MAG: hypothetical protein JXJ18_01770 [Rhodobacteraceae bacterium]|nr:hypothetical protein [Paracoccaceae bacterium]